MDYSGVLDPEIAAAWLASLDVLPKTKSDYDLALRTFCQFIGSCSYDFDALEADHVREYKDYLAGERGLAPATVSHYLSGLRSFYQWSEPRGIKNAAESVRGPKSPRGFKKADLSPTQAKDLIASFGNPKNEKGLRDRAIVSLMLHTALRDIEVVRANKGNLTTSGGHEVLEIWGKGRDEPDELVKISPELSRHLRAYLRKRPHLRKTDPLFASVSPRNKGGRLTTRSVSGIVKSSLRNIGLDDPRYTAHSLRHSAITFALLGGAAVEEAQAMARHADISTTMIYAHHINRLEDAAEDAVALILDGEDSC